MAKLTLSDIQKGSLVNKVHDVTVEFVTLDDEPVTLDLYLKQLPFVETEELHKRLAKEDKKVVAEWIAKSVVDADGKPAFTQRQVEDNFIQSLANAVFDKIMGLDKVKKQLAQTGKNKKAQ